jgi:uncharacterized protein (DUF362 family)
MIDDERDEIGGKRFSRRTFLAVTGAAASGLLIPPLKKSTNLFAFPSDGSVTSATKVAATQAFNYDRAAVKQRVQHLFEALGGIGDVIKPGDKVAIKINITGGTSYDHDPRLNGVPLVESVWTHPEVLRAVGELILDSGVNARDLYIVEAIWDAKSYNNYGYLDVQNSLGCQLVNLNNKAPYSDFIDRPVGDRHFFYESFKLNRILDEVNAFVSIPKMKQHLNAGATHSMKNLIGIVPLTFYGGGWRSQLHFDGGDINTHLPRSICDLNLVRPIHLAVIDGIKNSEGGELPTAVSFHPTEYHLLLAGKDPVAADSISALQMGNDPEAEKLDLPGGGQCDNHLFLANQKGMGTNRLTEIELVGDGAGSLQTSVQERSRVVMPERIELSQNFPNPFNVSTTIRYYLPETANASLKVYDSLGREIETLIESHIRAGEHELMWTAGGLPSGVYYCKLRTINYSATRKLLLQK